MITVKTSFLSALPGLRHHAGAFAFSGASQIVSSLTNFGIVLYLVRVLDKEGFGLYSLSFTVCLIIAALLTATLAIQFVVNNPDKPADERQVYAMHHVAALLVIGIIFLLLAKLIEFVLMPTSTLIVGGVKEMMLPMMFAAVGFALRDMTTRIGFVEKRAGLVLGSALVTAFVAAIGFFAEFALNVIPSPHSALGIVSLSQIAGGGVVLLLMRMPWKKASLVGLQNAFSESWQGGRWHALSSIIYSIRTHAHNLVVLPILGLAALAEVNAARILLTPAVMAIPPLFHVVMPQLAEKRSQDMEGMLRALWLVVAGVAGLALLYSIILLLVLDPLLPLMLGKAYSGTGQVVIAWCVFVVFLAARNGLSMGLEVQKVFAPLLAMNTIAALAAVLLAVVLSTAWGAVGAVWALVMAEFLLCVLLMLIYLVKGKRAKLCSLVGSSNGVGD